MGYAALKGLPTHKELKKKNISLQYLRVIFSFFNSLPVFFTGGWASSEQITAFNLDLCSIDSTKDLAYRLRVGN
jgi:hypothetical protein